MRKSSTIRITRALLVLIALLVCGTALWRQKSLEPVYLDDKPILVEVAHTEETQLKGLSGRKQLAAGHGMLFAFGEPKAACMWMKDMYIDLDVYWYTATGHLISSYEDVQSDSFPRLYCPEVLANYMLEVNRGEFDKPPKKLVFQRPL